jgi:S1-C subfamily serine protease
MDLRHVFTDDAVKQEFLDRFGELAAYAPTEMWGGLESLEGGLAAVDAADAAIHIAEGTFQPGSQPGLEAIIERFTRPVYLVQQSTFTVPPDDFPDSEEIKARLGAARARLEEIIPSAVRIDLRNHRLDWVGTGWMVGDGIVVTNRHVANEFASRGNGGFGFRQNFGAPPVRASIDWRHEYLQSEESSFRVDEVLWIEPEGSLDVALLRIETQETDGNRVPRAVDLMTRGEIDAAGVGAWVAVVGYPAQDSRNDTADQQRIFDGIYNVKRLAPGQLTAVVAEDLLYHDATTLGGNSGSVVIGLDSGKALGLHFGGLEGARNEAVQASRVREIIDERVA